ncbi:MAG: biotin--[acetyl-CoA-carboxylase] ligase [Bdellovibrionales bacterium]|nr:biotin--[acetyl-CoA-carboxylase] ligase [Bdellovibrionales bacterium]
MIAYQGEKKRSLEERAQKLSAHYQRVGIKAVWLGECASTMAEAKRHYLLSGGSPVIVVSDIQTAGRGRRENEWVSDYGNLHYTAVLPMPGEISKIAGYSLLIGIALADFFRSCGVSVQLKWPNDILCSGKKVGGILLETLHDRTLGILPGVLVGIGVNLCSAPDGIPMAGVLTHGQVLASDMFRTILEISDRVLRYSVEFQREGFRSFVARYLEFACYRNEVVVASVTDDEIVGVYTGIGNDGALQLQTENGLIELYSVNSLRPIRSF